MHLPKPLLAATAAGLLLVGGGTAIAATGDSGSSSGSGTQQQGAYGDQPNQSEQHQGRTGSGQAQPGRPPRDGQPCPEGAAPRGEGQSGSSSYQGTAPAAGSV